MSKIYSPKIVTDSLVMCLDASQNKSYPAADLPVKNGLVMWMDAADDTTFSYSSGTTVSQWRDKSGFNYHMVPVSAGPTRNSSLASRKVLTFTTSQQIWNSSINLVTSAYTIFCVTRLTGTTNARVLSTQYVPSTGGNWLLGHWSGYVNQYYAEGWVSGPYGTAANTAWNVFMGDWSGSSTDLANLYTNGTAITTNSNGANSGPIGLGVNINSETSTCEAAEIVVFDRVLSVTERKQVNTYLGQKWGISNTDRSIIDLSGNGINPEMSNTIFSPYNCGVIDFNGKAIGTNAVSVMKTTTSLIDRADGQEITVSCWIKPLRTSGQYSVFCTNRSDNDAIYNWIFYQHTNDGAISFHGDNQNKSSYVPTVNQWVNVVATVTGAGLLTLYINGASNYTVSGYTYGNGTPSRLGIGADPSSAEGFQGSMGQTLIYNRALSAAEVAQNYEAQKSKFANTIVQQGLVLNLDAGNPYSYGGAGTTWYDVSGNSYNGTLTNGPTYSSDVGGTIVFDGVNDYVTTSFATTSGQSVTYCGWLYSTESTSTYKNFVDSLSTSPMIWWNTSGQIEFDESRYTTTTVYRNQWVYVSLSKPSGSSSASYYVNGVLVGTGTAYTTPALIPTLFNRSAAQTWKGNGAVVQIYNRALSAAEVLQNYNATKGRFGL
jgi:hypothetical protein